MKLKDISRAGLPLALLAGFCALPLAGCQESEAEEFGEEVDEAVDEVGDELDNAANEIENAID